MPKKRISTCFLVGAILAQVTIVAQQVADAGTMATNVVARFVENGAQQTGFHKLKRTSDEYLLKDACYRAAGNNGVVPLFQKYGTISILRYSTSDLNQSSSLVQSWLSHIESSEAKYGRRFDVAVCVRAAGEHPQYWIDVGLYYGAITTFFRHFEAD